MSTDRGRTGRRCVLECGGELDHPSSGHGRRERRCRINRIRSRDLLRRGLLLEYATLAWNAVGTVVIVAAAIEARSVALAGFGLDSLIEIFASMIVVWQLRERRSAGNAPRCVA